MKTNFRFLALSAAILSMFTACQREELEQNQKPETPTYKVCFVTDEPDTKTSFEVVDGENGKVAKFSWKSTDSDKFTVYRILEDTFVQASITEGSYDEKTGLMSLNAIFEGTNSPEGAKYQAVFNSSVKSSQSGNQTVYDQTSDVMISNIVDANAFDNQPMMIECAKQIVPKKLTVRDVEKMAKRPARASEPKRTQRRDSFYDEVELSLSEALGTKVKVYNGRSKGTLEIEFYTLDDLKNIANAIAK